MTRAYYPGLRHPLAFYGLMVLFFTGGLFPAKSVTSPSKPLTNWDSPQSRRFIVAFELTQENEFTFTWPFESMQPAPYEAVIMVVEKMPRVREESDLKNDFEPMVASRCVRINGRRQKPYRTVNRHAFFLVKLNDGRLRVSVEIPRGLSIDEQHKTASIKLYQVDEN